ETYSDDFYLFLFIATICSTLANLEGDESFDPSLVGQAEEVVQERICDDELILVKKRNCDDPTEHVNIQMLGQPPISPAQKLFIRNVLNCKE
uniref:Uncharacterized protein n=1 Tax=Callorhinchus milii TaxID=7868 RepID=A0A4W3GJP0_CALMI